MLLVEETGGSGENQRPVISHWQILSHNVVNYTKLQPTSSVNIDKVLSVTGRFRYV
jgi:hypothetical protein